MLKNLMIIVTLTAPTFIPSPALARMNDDDKAVSMVLSFPKVKEFSDRMSASKQAVQAVAERKSKCVFNVHVYEDHPDHVSTFGFFNADICRGKVVEEE